MQAFLYQFFHMVFYITFYYLYLGVKKIKRNRIIIPENFSYRFDFKTKKGVTSITPILWWALMDYFA